MPGQTQLTFRLPASLVKRLDRFARQVGDNRSEILRKATEAYLEVAEGLDQSRSRDHETRNLIGSLSSGAGHLAERHSEYVTAVLRKAKRDGR
jgi:metal-responsive CopG/Arc/MetJ family transcriptional regulator